MSREAIDIRGHVFDRLTVISREPNSKSNQTMWLCKCSCGTERVVSGGNLRNGHTRSCGGCLYRESSTKHGMSRTRLYNIWSGMKNRCYDVNADNYNFYGGRGIVVCDEWKTSFESFRDWALANGYRDDLSIDRIDSDGDYEAKNCRWATFKAQVRNRRSNIVVIHNGKDITLTELSEATGIKYRTLRTRYLHGDTNERLIREVRCRKLPK